MDLHPIGNLRGHYIGFRASFFLLSRSHLYVIGN